MVTKTKKWEKILYKDQGKEDNYVSPTFLLELKKNKYSKHYSYCEAMLGAISISCEISNVCGLFVAHKYLEKSYLSSIRLLTILIGITVPCYLWYFCHSDEYFLKSMKSIIIFFTFGCGMSPVLKTLTDTISSNTINDMAIMMMIIHLIFFEYGSDSVLSSTSLSFNAAIFSAVCLASRLHSVFDVFIFLTLTVEIFAIFPLWQKKFKEVYSKMGEIFLLFISVGSSIAGIFTLSKFWAIIISIFIIFINIICPVWYVKWQHYKDNVYGPWDEAVIDDSDLKERH